MTLLLTAAMMEYHDKEFVSLDLDCQMERFQTFKPGEFSEPTHFVLCWRNPTMDDTLAIATELDCWRDNRTGQKVLAVWSDEIDVDTATTLSFSGIQILSLERSQYYAPVLPGVQYE